MRDAHKDNLSYSHASMSYEVFEQVFYEQCLFPTSPEAGEQLLKMLDEPATETEGLLRLRDVKIPWQNLNQRS